jgi:hypothetical protein
MLKAYKTEFKPTPEQMTKIVQAMGVCRFLYNQYLAHKKLEKRNQHPDFGLEYLDYSWSLHDGIVGCFSVPI